LGRLLVVVGVVIVFIGLFVMWLTPNTYTQIVEVGGETAEATITEIGFDPAGLWLSVLGLGLITVGVGIDAEDIKKELTAIREQIEAIRKEKP